ncbi:hypothetical protein [Exiguobacterium sp. K1]|uniref:hypothetical protein n=1 Tax=Exiguobacterium sp. K1 TaxID=2980105 RepID=UPI00299E11C1|nr:hypothetical protein [Exiguobacterium sp. K1]MDX1259152.1 hypothetical protein [Exiguobacterium sp. K1]
MPTDMRALDYTVRMLGTVHEMHIITQLLQTSLFHRPVVINRTQAFTARVDRVSDSSYTTGSH